MPRVLIVEDTEGEREALSRQLQNRGYDVITASDGEQGIAMARAESPDIILMDMNMPVLDGWQATRRLKADEGTRELPVIALTAYVTPEDREKALDAGCMDCYAEPADFGQLTDRIAAVIQERGEARIETG